MSRRNKAAVQGVTRWSFRDILREKKLFVLIYAVIVLLICFVYLQFEWNRYQSNAASEAISLGKTAEALQHPEHIKELSGTTDDLDKYDYLMMKNGLTRLVETTTVIRFAYIYSEKSGDIVFLVDSETPDSEDYSHPGQIYDEATEATWEPLLTGETILTEPETDRWGTWISALVPVKDSNTGEVIAVLGLDYNAAVWQSRIWSRMIPNFIIIIIFLVLNATLLHIFLNHQKFIALNTKLEFDEALYHSIFEQAPIGIAIVNDKRFELYSKLGNLGMNQMIMKILDRSSDELETIDWTEITHPDDLQADLDQFSRFQRGEINGYTIEKRFIRPDGSSVWTNMKISSLRGLPYSHTTHLCLLEDITARKESEESLQESERSKSVLVSNLPGLAYRCDYDREWTMRFVSDGCFALTGYTPEMLIDNKEISFNDIIAPKYREILWKQWAQRIALKQPLKSEYEIITADGQHKWVMEFGEGIFNKHGEVVALEGIILDISSKKASERNLRNSLKRTKAMISDHQAIMMLVEPGSGKIVEANKAAIDFYGYSKSELLRLTVQDIHILGEDEVQSLHINAYEKGQKYITLPQRMKNGAIRIVDIYSSPIDYGNRKLRFSIIVDVTKREEIARENEYLAYHDYLTGLYNRRYYEAEFQRRVDNQDFPVGVFIGDIDGFKEYNDTFGHAEGDKILTEVAKNLRALVGNEGMLARIGGDEFAIILSGKSHLEMRKYLDKLNHDYDSAHDQTIIIEAPPSISWGYALQRTKDDTLDALEEEAEAFMYNRKFYSHQSLRSKTVDTIMETLFTKSEREKLHSERVGLLSEAIARQMHLPSESIDKIRVAGFLHDIGKIGIDEAILNKAGKLDDNEWEIIKLHPAKSAGILDKTHEYQDITDIVLSHHERYDGNGYPGKLQAEAIPLAARIIAVADTYDALTNDRPYKNAMDKGAAIEELKRSAGTQLDPAIVSVFIEKVLSE